MNIESPSWNEQAFVLDEVRRWVISTLGMSDQATVIPIATYAAYTDAPDIRLTSRFAARDTSGPTQEVVFKGNRFPLLAATARAHALVSRHCSGRVPYVLNAQDESDGSSRILYVPFEGRAIDDSALLVETARTIAAIQNAVTASGEGEATQLPHVAVKDIPGLFDAVYSHIEAHQSAWHMDTDGCLSRALGFPATHVLPALDAVRAPMSTCADAIAALDLPDSIDHSDLHGGNAVVQANGTVLIHDWENATWGCPLLSLEKLLVAAWRIDAKPTGGGPWGYAPGTPTQALVRDAYRDVLGRNAIAPQTFAAAMCLATVKEMHAEIVWANATGWSDGNPEWTAQLIRRLHYHLREA